jgi:hypothetical protein
MTVSIIYNITAATTTSYHESRLWLNRFRTNSENLVFFAWMLNHTVARAQPTRSNTSQHKHVGTLMPWTAFEPVIIEFQRSNAVSLHKNRSCKHFYYYHELIASCWPLFLPTNTSCPDVRTCYVFTSIKNACLPVASKNRVQLSSETVFVQFGKVMETVCWASSGFVATRLSQTSGHPSEFNLSIIQFLPPPYF